jgi:hypothetical protein
MDPLRQKIRARYFNARFPDAPAVSEDPSAVIKAARYYFEDGNTRMAIELLEYAAASMPREELYWLARLEIHFLTDNAKAYVATAHLFREHFPMSPSWPEVSRLGRRIAPAYALFATGQAAIPEVGDQFGAWPEVPNWIEAPWDLTGEVLAVELRGRLIGNSGALPRRPQ